MRLSIICVGRLRAGSERELGDRFVTRVNQLGASTGAKLAVREIAESRKPRPQDRREDEAAAITTALPEGATIVALDARGAQLSSESFAERLAEWRDQSVGEVCFVIGGADGLAESLTGKANLVLSLGKMTWPHQLARVMLAEQLYRAMTIILGHPYHRG